MMKQPALRRLTAILFLLLLLAARPGAAGAAAAVYEPPTSLALPATILWQADAGAIGVAKGSARPASALVYLDATLRVMTDSGELISPSLKVYLEATSQGMIPALYVRDQATADALYGSLQAGPWRDLLVAAPPEGGAWVARLCSLPQVHGLIDFGDLEGAGEEMLDGIIASTNRAHAKIALLPQALATGENVNYLQTRLITVWAWTGSNRADLIGALSRGVNGVAVRDFGAALDALAFFQDDAPSLLRLPRIAGHRGMPSVYAENTLMSAQGAFSAGADIIENDIYLSRDGQIFILHDPSLKRLFDRGDIKDAESLTLAELQAIPFSFSGFNGVPAANHTPADKSRDGRILQDSTLRIPSLREYFSVYKDTDIVHFVEIKSHNPAIVPALKALCGEMGTAGQIAVISFNSEILDAMARDWPEMSLGALGTEGVNLGDARPGFLDYGAIARSDGVAEALPLLFKVLAPWNATYHPKANFTYALAEAGRHRGLTVWPWTYNDPKGFAEAYLRGVYGLTTNFAWWASGLVTRVEAEDLTLALGEAPPLPRLITQSGEPAEAEGLTLLTIAGEALRDGAAVKAGEAVAIWRALRSLVIDGRDYGTYYLYSEPVTVRVE